MFVVATAQVERWQVQYPGVDVRREVLAMGGWLEANPKNRKTRDGILRFAANWLKRAQDNSRPDAGRPVRGRASPPAPRERTKADYVGTSRLQPDGSYLL